MTQIQARMVQLMKPIDIQIMMCDSREEVLMLACAMLRSSMTILDANIGKHGRTEIVTDANESE